MTAKHDQWKYALIERHITKGIVHFVPPYTLFELELDNGCRYVGLAQQGHGDEWSERIGYDVAYGRAMQQAIRGSANDLRVKDEEIPLSVMQEMRAIHDKFVENFGSFAQACPTLLIPVKLTPAGVTGA